MISLLSENLKRIRMEQRYSRKQLGGLTGITPTTIQMIENGKNDNPRLKTVLALSKALKVPIATLIK